MKNLYHIQDSDRPMYVVALSWADALVKWKERIAEENEMSSTIVEEPQGISLIAEANDLLF